MFSVVPGAAPSLTAEARRTQTGEVAHSVLTGAAVPAGVRGALVHVDLAVGALETRHAEARVPVPTCSADGAVLARVWRALVLWGGRPAERDTFILRMRKKVLRNPPAVSL